MSRQEWPASRKRSKTRKVSGSQSPFSTRSQKAGSLSLTHQAQPFLTILRAAAVMALTGSLHFLRGEPLQRAENTANCEELSSAGGLQAGGAGGVERGGRELGRRGGDAPAARIDEAAGIEKPGIVAVANVDEEGGSGDALDALTALGELADESGIFGEIHFGIANSLAQEGFGEHERAADHVAHEHAVVKVAA